MARVSAMDAVGRNKVKLDYFAHGSTTTTTRRYVASAHSLGLSHRHPNMKVLHQVLDAVIAATTLSLRYSSILFVRFVSHSRLDLDSTNTTADVRQYPIARYWPRIYTTFAAYAFLALVQLQLTRRHARIKRHPLLVILLGWVDVTRPLLSAVGALVNIICVVCSVDFVYRAHYLHQSNDLSFSRMGYTTSTSASIVIRAPNSPVVEINARPDFAAPGGSTSVIIDGLSQETDWLGTATLDNLLPDTPYVYTTNASHVGSFRTPKQHPKQWTMIQTSCIKPFYPYHPADHALSIKGLEHLGRYLSNRTVEFMLFLGDFIYIDLPYPIGWTQRHYTDLYRQTYASPSWTPALRALPWLHVYDDHEFANDWSTNETGLYKAAVAPYWHYQGRANPPSAASYYTFTRGEVAFFVLDTRRYRSPSEQPDGPRKTMLGAIQLARLREWLREEPRWKVVVSSVPWTRTWVSPDEADRWAGYLHEREMIYEWMRETDGVLLLSGVSLRSLQPRDMNQHPKRCVRGAEQ